MAVVKAEGMRARIARWLTGVPNSIWIMIGAGVILAVSALFGGLDDADLSAKEPPVVGAGDTVARDELTTVVHAVRVSDAAPGYSFEPDDGFTYLIVEATVTNNGLVTSISTSDLLTIDALEEPTVTRTARLIDGTTLPELNPGLPTEVAFVWVIPEDEIAPGDTVRLTLYAKSFTEDGDLTFGSYWADPQPTAFIDLEVQ